MKGLSGLVPAHVDVERQLPERIGGWPLVPLGTEPQELGAAADGALLTWRSRGEK